MKRLGTVTPSTSAIFSSVARVRFSPSSILETHCTELPRRSANSACVRLREVKDENEDEDQSKHVRKNPGLFATMCQGMATPTAAPHVYVMVKHRTSNTLRATAKRLTNSTSKLVYFTPPLVHRACLDGDTNSPHLEPPAAAAAPRPCLSRRKPQANVSLTPKEPKTLCLDEEQLRRRLYDGSAVFTRAAHALELAADQLREAHSRDFAAAATEAESAAMVAMHAALSVHRLVGAYELAAWMQAASESGG